MTDSERAALQAKVVALKARLIVMIERSRARIRDSERMIKRTDERLRVSSSTLPWANASPPTQAVRLNPAGPSANDADNPPHLPARAGDDERTDSPPSRR